MNNSRFILVGRVLLLSGAVAVVIAAFALRRAADGAGGGDKAAAVAMAYACPMHPEVTGTRATGCPICGMALEPVRLRPRVAGPADTFSLPAGGSNRQFFDVMFARLHPVASDMRGPAWIDGDGVWRARLYGADWAWLRRLVLRNAGSVSVIEPAELAADVSSQAALALRAYDVQ